MNELFDAIKAGDAAKVAALLDADFSLLGAKQNNVSAILFALYHGKRGLARLFVDRGAELSFAEAAAMGDLARVRELLDADPSLLDRRSDDGFPPVGLAIFFGQPETARFLIERGADVNAAADNPMRVAPLHAAAGVRDRESMRLLLERGADPNAKQQMDYRPIHGVAARGDIEMAELLFAHGAERDVRGSDQKTPADVAREHDQHDFARWIESLS